jgi:hypothetical protein
MDPSLMTLKYKKMLDQPIDGLKGLDIFQLEIRKARRRAYDVFDYSLVDFLPLTKKIVNQAVLG